jgi:hypothetical protein
MADPPRSPDPRPPSAPRWVKLLGIIAIVVVLLVVVILIASGGEHGPSRHLPGDGKPGVHTLLVQQSP